MTNNTKAGRISSIDMIRGIAIVGMVLCANIGFHSGLPAWMFHAQTPPPTYAFNPDAAGLTWVDLVFPFFLFSMGAAFPLAMRKKLENGVSRWPVAGGLVKRWFILTVFALVLGNVAAIGETTRPVWQIYTFTLAVWAGLFLSLVRIQNPTAARWVNCGGVALLSILSGVLAAWFGIPLDKGRCDIIIMILAVMAVFGGLIWMFTKDNLRLRWLVFLLVAAFKALDSYVPEALSFVPPCPAVGWFFSWEWLQYLLVVIPGSIVGDLILGHVRSGEKVDFDGKAVAAGFVALAAVLVQLWGLYTRRVPADLAATTALFGAFGLLIQKRKDIFTMVSGIGFCLLIAGIIFDPIDGGITKDYCNLSYLFTTCGMAVLVTAFLLMLETRFAVKGPFLSGAGQNPMIAYTVTNFVISPLLYFCGLLPLLNSLAEGSQFWGVAQGIIITFLMMCITYMFTRLKLFWRS